MKISHNRLRRFIDIDETPEQTGQRLTASGLEVEGILTVEQIKGSLAGLVLGKVLSCAPHSGADKLKVTMTDIGADEPVQIVCGAPNVAAGLTVVVAPVGSELYPEGEKPFKIKKAKIRGEVSFGMICAEDEIGLGTDHDGIIVLDTDLPAGTPAAAYFKPGQDSVYEIGLTPNRADATSHFGTARDLKVLLNKPLTLPSVEAFAKDNEERKIEVEVRNSEACPRYSSVSISGVIVGESPDWLKFELKALGIGPINNVVDATNFVLHELGQPLHAFDADKISGNKVLVDTLPAGTPFTTLDGTERKLAAEDLMICDGTGRPMCIAGVFGGIDSGITETTQNVFLESAYFSADFVRKTSLHHGLKTDASFRFERGTDPNITVFALKRAALLIKELAGGQISSDISDIYPVPVEPFRFRLRYERINLMAGQEMEPALVKNILEGLEIGISEEDAEGCTVSVPPYRVDVRREADIAEEILRIYGYDNISVESFMGSPFLASFPQKDEHRFKTNISEMLTGIGYSEIMTNSLTKADYSASVSDLPGEDVVILNRLSEELGVMRRSLIFTGLEVLARNINRKYKDLKTFEFGKIYYKKESENDALPYGEEEHLGLFVTGGKTAENWQEKYTKADYFDLSAGLHKILGKFGFENADRANLSDELFAYGLTYSYKGEELARAGMVSPKACKMLGIKQDVFYAQIRWKKVTEKYESRTAYKDLSKFPFVRRDLSLVLDQKVSFEAVKDLAFRTERNLLEEVNVFDVYEGENLGEGKKAYSVSFFLRHANATLTDKQIDKTMQKLMNACESDLGAIIRK